MSLLCLFGVHHPSLASIAKRQGGPVGLVGLCEHCARPLAKKEDGKWRAEEPLYERGAARG